MNFITAALIWIAIIFAGIGIAVAMHLHNFASDCDSTGGTFSNEGMTTYCRY